MQRVQAVYPLLHLAAGLAHHHLPAVQHPQKLPEQLQKQPLYQLASSKLSGVGLAAVLPDLGQLHPGSGQHLLQQLGPELYWPLWELQYCFLWVLQLYHLLGLGQRWLPEQVEMRRCQLAGMGWLGSLVRALQQLPLVMWAVQELLEGYFRVGCSPGYQWHEQLLGQLLGAGPVQQQRRVSLAVGWGNACRASGPSNDVLASGPAACG